MSIDTTPEQTQVSEAATVASSRRDVLVATAAGAAVLLASLVNFLGYNDYPLFRAEVGLVALFLVAVALAMGLVYAVMQDLGRVVLQLLLVMLALDLNFDVRVAMAGTVVLGIVLNRRMMPFLGIAASVVLVTGLAGFGPGAGPTEASQARPVPVASDAPALVHIILDEHIGIEGLLGDAPEVSAMRERLKAFYIRHGFRLFGGAYSEYLHTVNAIPQMLNFGVEQARNSLDREGTELTVNAYFDRLGALGYRIHVAQTDFLDYCENRFVVACSTRRASDPHDLVDAPIPVGEKFRLLVNEMANLSRLIQGAATTYDLIGVVARNYHVPLPVYRLDTHRLPTAIGALETFDRLAASLRRAVPGDAFFVHELLPHYPYVMDGDCRLKDTTAWRNRNAPGASKKTRSAAYFDQLSCVMTRLDTLLDALAASPAGMNAIVLVHGDHGSRITNIDAIVETEGNFTDSDLITGHATLFAVRAPAIAAGYDPRRQPAARLLDALAASRFRSAEMTLPPGFVHSVVLENKEWEPVRRHPLPESWIAAP